MNVRLGSKTFWSGWQELLQWMLGWVRFGADFLPDWLLQCTTNHRRTGENGEREKRREGGTNTNSSNTNTNTNTNANTYTNTNDSCNAPPTKLLTPQIQIQIQIQIPDYLQCTTSPRKTGEIPAPKKHLIGFLLQRDMLDYYLPPFNLFIGLIFWRYFSVVKDYYVVIDYITSGPSHF